MSFLSKFFSILIFSSLIFTACSERQVGTSEMQASHQAAAMPDTATSSERIVIKTADISMDVRNVEKSVLNFQSLVNDLNGHVFHYEIQNDKSFQNEVAQTSDSSMIIEEIRPGGLLKVKIPVANGDTFIAQVLKMEGSISQFIFAEEDITEDINQKRELMQSDHILVSDNKGGTSKAKKMGNADDIYLRKELNESFINRKAAFSSTNYQSKFLWFDIKFSGQKYLSKTMTASFKPVRTPFVVSVTEALREGWNGISVLLIFLIRIWPLILGGLLIALIWKKRGRIMKVHLGS